MYCPLCSSKEVSHYFQDKRREYLQCGYCQLVFVPEAFHLLPEQELAEYQKHQNHLDDPGYRTFLTRLFEPMANEISPPANVLDFGCGPGPALASMFREKGYKVECYDPYFANDPSVLLAEAYHMVTATEVVEHLSEPGSVFANLFSYLKPEGCLGIMTKLVINRDRFATWHYKNDPTHICFYAEPSLDYIADKYQYSWQPVATDAFIFKPLTS
jgi:hypothetical protein